MYVYVSLVIRQVKGMRRVIGSSVTCLVLPYFLHHLKRYDFWKNVAEHKVCVLVFFTTFARKIYHFKQNSTRCYYKCK